MALYVLCFFLALITSHAALVLALPKEGFRNIPITRCCPGNEFYLLPSGTCTPDDLMYQWPPSVYSKSDNLTVSATDLRPFDLSEQLENCTDGQGVFVSTKFMLYDDGTVLLRDGTRLEANEFCVNPADVEGEFVVLHCAIDPCYNNETNCVRKCCPEGMAINATTKKCQTSSLRFVVDFKNESGISVRPDDESFVVRDGVAPLCPHGKYALNSKETEDDEFFILPDGRLYQALLPEGEQYTREYCVENWSSGSSSTENLIALLCFAINDSVDLSEDVQTVISIFPYFIFVSSAFLIATFIVYLMLPRLRNVHGLTIMCYTLSLTTLYISLGITQLKNDKFTNAKCLVHASIMHFAFLSSFTWLNVMSLDIWLTLKNIQPRRSRYGQGAFGKRFAYYSIYAWGLPLIIVLIGRILQHQYGYDSGIITPSFSRETCWFPRNEAGPFWLYLYGPIATLILVNLVFFLLALRIFYQANVDNVFANNHARTKQKFRVVSSLFFLMGISWAVEVISFAVGGSAYIWLTFDIINILTGVFIFVIFVCKPSVWKLLKKQFPRLTALDPCCPTFMKNKGAYRNVRSSTRNMKSMDTSFTTHGATNQQPYLNSTENSKKDRKKKSSNHTRC